MAFSQNTTIILKYSDETGIPPSLNIAEPAYSNVSNKLFINDGDAVVAIGGKYYTDIIDSADSQNTPNTIVTRDESGVISASKYLQSNFDLFEHSNAAFNRANVITPVAVTTISNHANAAFNKANTAAGANGEIQFNLNGGYGSHNGLYYNVGSKTLYANTINASRNVDAQNIIAYNRFYAGVATQLATPVPYLLAQFTGNSAPYAQVNLQNINSDGSADIVVTGDVGTDETFYITTGMQGSQLEQGALYPLDGYVLVQGNTSQLGGNLVIGAISGTPGIKTKIISGGFETSNLVAEFDESSVIFYPEITSPTTTRITLHTAAAYDSQNTSGLYANSAYLHANASFEAANNVFPQIQPSYNHANSAYVAQNTTGIYANSSYSFANTVNAYFYGVNFDQNTSIGILQAQSDAAYLHANSAYDSQNTTGIYANSAYALANTKFASAGGTITGDVNITANLIVSGTATYVNTTTVLIGDNIITLNADIPQDLAPTENAGIEIDRGTSVNTSLIWNEATDKWTFTNDGTNYSNIGSAASEVYANSAYIHANSAYIAQNTTGIYANAAYTQANAAFIKANTAAGSDGQLQFNTSGGFGASANLKFSNTTNTLTSNNINVTANIGYTNTAGVLKVYQFYNEATNSLDTVFV